MKALLRLYLPLLVLVLLSLTLTASAPHQALVGLYKFGLMVLGGLGGYLVDCLCFPYARPHSYLAEPWKFRAGFKEGQADFPVAVGEERLFLGACFRRALIVVGAMIALGVAL